MWRGGGGWMYGKTGDVESGVRPLYPMMLETPELRWLLIRKIYTILTLQWFLTVAAAAAVVSIRPISVFFSTTGAGFALYIVLIISPLIVLYPLYYYSMRHPINLVLLLIFMVLLSLDVGLTCAFVAVQLSREVQELEFDTSSIQSIQHYKWKS